MHSATPPGSRQTYKAWNHFLDVSTRYCGTAFQQLPLGISDIVLFVAYLSAKKLAPSTISTYISALSYVRKIGSFSDPTKAFVVQKITTAQSKFCSKLDIRLPIRKSCEHSPEINKPKLNQTKRRSDNRGSAGVDCHIYRRRNKHLQRRHGPWKRVLRLQSSWIVVLRKVQNRAELEQHF